jgi:hypothetical protein
MTLLEKSLHALRIRLAQADAPLTSLTKIVRAVYRRPHFGHLAVEVLAKSTA